MKLFVWREHSSCSCAVARVNAKTVAFYFHRLRRIIGLATADETPFSGEIEVDESYFGGARKGKRGRGAAGKTPVFGLLKRGGKVCAKVIPDARRRTLFGIIQDKVVPDSIVYSDSYNVYDVLDESLSSTSGSITRRSLLTDGITSTALKISANQAKRHMRKFNGIPKEHFPLFPEGVRVALQ